jgi:hypothetical protein
MPKRWHFGVQARTMKIVLFFGKGNGYEAPAYRQAGVSYEINIV